MINVIQGLVYDLVIDCGPKGSESYTEAIQGILGHLSENFQGLIGMNGKIEGSIDGYTTSSETSTVYDINEIAKEVNQFDTIDNFYSRAYRVNDYIDEIELVNRCVNSKEKVIIANEKTFPFIGQDRLRIEISGDISDEKWMEKADEFASLVKKYDMSN